MMFKLLSLAAMLAVARGGSNAKSIAYLEENKGKPGVTVLPSGLQYKVLRRGGGMHHPTVDSPCECHYEGKLIDGTKFDSSYDRGSPTTFAPNQVIKGWTEAMQLMVEGDKWEMYIPSELGYGDRGSPPKIGGGDALVFQMEIIKIKGGKKDAVRCDPHTEEGCSDKEKKFLAKIANKYGGDLGKLETELKRLKGMGGSKMKPELQQWLTQRTAIISQLVQKKKDEL